MQEKKVIGRVIQILSNTYEICINDSKEIIKSGIRGNIKGKNNVLVGDQVEIEKVSDTYIISKIISRKNFFIRPPISNIDNLVICLSITDPEPDYLLLDKEIVLCFYKGVRPIICLNKVDLIEKNEKLKEEIEYLNRVYGSLGIDIIYTSTTKKIGIDDLKNKLKGSISAFSGNSGVGKSSLTSIFSESMEIQVGEISKKNLKGKNTTKYVRLYKIEKDTYILDTPGFSSYELFDIEHKELKKYYLDFQKYKCKYEDCSHILEDDCGIKENVENGNVDIGRYERYKYLYLELFEKYKRKYK